MDSNVGHLCYYFYMTRNERRNKARAIKWRTVRIHKATLGCTDCGMSDSRCLQFDHLSDKVANVSDMIRSDRAWRVIVDEIAKCEVVCANCHAIRTEVRKGK